MLVELCYITVMEFYYIMLLITLHYVNGSILTEYITLN